MRIHDRTPTSELPDRHRRFAVSDNFDDVMRPGALVCLRDAHGDLLGARHGARGAWELGPLQQRSRSSSIPSEALFTVLRRGSHVGFQCLGAEGRMVQACEQAGAGHALAHGFGSREAWEAAPSGALLNAHFRFKELGGRALAVTALPTADLAQWEQEAEIRVGDALARLEAHTATAAAQERHAAELIKAGQRAAGGSRRELEEARERAEAASRAALHWQEQAALAGEAAREAEAELARLRAGGAPGLSFAAPNDEVAQELRAQIAALKLEHAGQVREVEARAAAALARAGGGAAAAAAIEAVRAEAAAALAAAEEAHAAEVACLLEDRARLDSALRCIKDMMGHPWGGGAGGANTEGEGGTWGEGDHCSPEGAPPGEAPAVGVPVDPLATPLAPSAARSGVRFAPPSAARSGVRFAPPSASPAPADFAVFDAAGVRCKIGRMYDLVNPLRPGSAAGTNTGTPSDSAQQEVYRFYPPDGAVEPADSDSGDDDGGPPRSRNRVLLANGGCSMVDYQGDRPDTVTEASMRRILDGPLGAAASGGGSDAEPKGDGPATGYRYGRGPRDSDELSYLLRQQSSAALRLGSPALEAAASAVKSDAVREALEEASPWAADGLSPPSSRNVTPVASPAPPPRPAPAEEAMAPSEAVAGLDSASPVAANFLAQYMADQVSVRASLPPGYGARAAAQRRPKSASLAKSCSGAGDTIPAVRRSAPDAAALKRSSFLQRPLVTERDLFGAGAN